MNAVWVLCLSLFCFCAFGATVSETSIALPTYPYGDPDPVPATSKTYWPYARYDRTSTTSVTQDWNAVVLESDRLRVTALPGVGGKVWGAVDKVTGREFIYFNHPVKFRDVAMCGPWCSGGIEFNFGIVGHHPTTAVPLPYAVRRNEDGSVSYFAGNTERICGTIWQVEVRLKDGDDFFTTRTQWFNASPLEQPYYQWMTAAYTARGGDPEMVFPGKDWIGHDGGAHPWPVDKDGHDLSRYSGNAFGSAKSYHVVGGDERYFAIWWPDYKLGSYHENAWGEKYGRKIFMWAQSRAGGIWEDLLTDTDGQYIELQSGRVFNQPQGETYRTPFKHPTFTPGRTDVFTERWGVVRDYAEIEARRAKDVRVERPVASPEGFRWDSAYGHYLAAQQFLRGELAVRRAKEECEKALAVDACFPPALDLMAEIAFRQEEFAAARGFAARALAVDAYDVRANYLDALACEKLGVRTTALERFGLAAYSMEFRSAAYAGMARVSLASGHAEEARGLARRCRLVNPLSVEGLRLGIAAAEAVGAMDEARSLRAQFAADWPVIPLAPAAEPPPATAGWRAAFDRAVRLASVGRDEDALEKLSACGTEPDDWVFYLYRARFQKKAELKAADLAEAARRGTDWRIVRDRAMFCQERNEHAEAEWLTAEGLRRDPDNNVLQGLYAQSLYALGKYRACVDFLKGIHVLPSEFGGSLTELWQKSWRELGDREMAETYPENLGSGKPYPEELKKAVKYLE